MALRIFLVSVLLSFAGCRFADENVYVEGTSLQLGIYVPVNGTVYGFQALNYLSGIKISCRTNFFPKIERETVSTNRYLGVVEIVESRKTSAK